MNEINIENCSFEECVQKDAELAEVRAHYAGQSAAKRRSAAEWEYDSSLASRAFDLALVGAGQEPFTHSKWPEGVLALAIEPTYAPALLTVGSIEYQLGREEEAMKLFMRLLSLPADEPDLHVIIDKAGDSLLDEKDYEAAQKLYEAAAQIYPDEATYQIGLCYCHGKFGKHEGAVRHARRAVELEPENPVHLNDLGWSLLEAGQLDEAEKVLRKAIELSPEDYALPRGNLQFVAAAKAEAKKAGKQG